MIKMSGRLLIFDKTDNISLRFPKECKLSYPEEVPFIHNFNYNDPGAVLGIARVTEDEKGLLCEVDLTNTSFIDRDILHNEFHDELCIGGYYINVKRHQENGATIIDEARLVSISTTFGPADDELRIRVMEDLKDET